MTLTRIVVVLLGTLVVLLAVVVLRAEAAVQNDRLAALESEAGELWQELRTRQLELARLRTPGAIRARVADQRMADEPTPGAAPPASRPGG